IRLSDIGKVDPDYRDVVRTAIQDLEDLYGQPIVRRVTLSGVSVFIASPNIVTPYHIDHEANFLCQISGHKEIYLYDPNDRELLPSSEIEQFYAGDGTAARYREDMLPRGRRFELAPGIAVHHPSLAPHRVRNGPEVSISVGINFCTHELDRRARVYQVNHLLRKAGFKPGQPDESRMLDAVKARGMQLICNPRPTSTPELLFSGLKRLRSWAQRLKAMTGFARRLASRLHAGLGR
ncbi:MAG: cupin-like domain-containing protein, partial [Lysobacter sp.]